VARFLLLGDTGNDRLDLSWGLNTLSSNQAMALVGAGLVRRIVCSQCLLRGSLDHLPVPSAILCLATEIGSRRIHGYGRNRFVDALSERFLCRQSPKEDGVGAGVRGVAVCRGGNAGAVGDIQTQSHPTYCFVCAAAAILAFIALYWICDVHKRVRWADFARPAGSNTLLTYLLPSLSFAVFGRAVLMERWDYGWPGALQAALFTAIIVASAAILSRLKIRIQL